MAASREQFFSGLVGLMRQRCLVRVAEFEQQPVAGFREWLQLVPVTQELMAYESMCASYVASKLIEGGMDLDKLQRIALEVIPMEDEETGEPMAHEFVFSATWLKPYPTAGRCC